MCMKVNLTIGIPSWLDRICAWPAMVYRRWKYGYSYRRIYLDEGLWTIVEPQDYYRFAGFKWCVEGNRRKFYAVRGAKISPDKIKMVSLHREIMNPPKGLLVDHRNNNSLDNRRANLRLATHIENLYNRQKTRSKTTSRFIGVSFDKGRERWCAYINDGGKRIWLGSFDNEMAAARTYDEAARKYRGEFARLNFTP